MALRARMGLDPPSEPPRDGDDHRHGGWRPGAHWAQEAGSDAWLERRIARKRAKQAAILAKIERLPLHQRPPMRELGRRSEGLPHPFRAGPRDEAAPPARAPYDLDGAFWEQGRTLGGLVAREFGRSSASLLGESSRRPPPANAAEDLPLVTTHRAGQRVVVAAACPAAQALGLAPGMPLTQARALVPGLEVRPADPDGVAADLARLAAHAARHWTPQVVIAPGEGLWLDIGAAAHLFGGEALFARRVLALCRRLRLTARIAIADSAAAALAFARTTNAPLLICPPGGTAAALAPLPLAALGIDPEIVDPVRQLGIDTVGALAAMPRAPLVRRFGHGTVACLDEALGARARPIDQLVPAETPRVCRRFAEPLLTAEPIATAVAGLVGELCALLAATHRGARRLVLAFTRVDAAEQRIAIGLARPSRDPAHIERLFGTKLDRVEPGFGIERAELVAERYDPLVPEALPSRLAGQGEEADEAVLVDRLATRLGERSIYRLGAVESDVPERSVRRLEATNRAPAGWHPWPRPVRLIDPPERVDGVVALLPDGVPKRFTWRGRADSIVRGDGPERIHGEWWRRAAERDSVRDYFQVEDRDGARFWLFRRGDAIDDRTGDLSWHLQGLFA